MNRFDPPRQLTLEERKRWLHCQINKCKQLYLEAIQPYIEELADIASHESPQDIRLPDGRVMQYVGPKARWTGESWDMSEFEKEEAK